MGDGKGRTEKRKNGKEDLEEVVDFVSLHKCLLVPLALPSGQSAMGRKGTPLLLLRSTVPTPQISS